MTPNGFEDAALLQDLADRSEGAEVGDVVDLTDLESWDRSGPKLFASLALRFGWRREGDFRWTRERVPRWIPGWVQPRHEAQWMGLFEAAFGYRMAESLWRWKYRHNPLPGMGAWRNGELVAFYGGMTRDVMYLGEPARTLQIGDVMTRPDERAVMTRTGPFQLAASTLIERCCGFGQEILFGYGFPTDKALKVAQRLGLYEQVDQMMELAWTPADSWRAGFDFTEPVTAADAADVDRMWREMAASMQDSVVGVRDWAYVADRYLGHPVNRYECLLVRQRLTHSAKGVIVIRDRGDDGIEVLDLIGDRAHWPDLVRATRRWLARHGGRRAFLWTTRSHVHDLASTSPVVGEMDLMVPANVWTPGPSPEALQGRWWLTAGDADFR